MAHVPHLLCGIFNAELGPLRGPIIMGHLPHLCSYTGCAGSFAATPHTINAQGTFSATRYGFDIWGLQNC